MSEFELSEIENTSLDNWDFPAIKLWFESVLKKYSTRVYTDEASAKADKTELNKVKKIVEDKRKEYKNQCLAPYQTAEKQVKEIVAMITIETERIDSSLKSFEAERKAKKEAEIREFYDKKSAPLGRYADTMFKKILNSSWLNASTLRKKWEGEVIVAIAAAASDIHKLNESPYAEKLIELYTGGMSLKECIDKNNEYLNVQTFAGINTENTVFAAAPVSYNTVSYEESVSVKIYGSKKQFEQVFDYMKVLGIKFDIM